MGNVSEYVAMAPELDSKVGVEIMGASGVLDVGHEKGLDIGGKVGNEG